MNKKAILIGLGAIAVISIYALFYINKNGSTEFSNLDAEFMEVVDEYIDIDSFTIDSVYENYDDNIPDEFQA
jgi:hypothetical protein